MVDNEVKVAENAPKKEGVVEQRIKPTIIRRRKVKEEPPKEEAKAAATEAALIEEPSQKEAAKKVEKASSMPSAHKKIEVVQEKRKSLTVIAQPEETKAAEKGLKPGEPVVARGGIKEKEAAELLARKAARKRKSRAELLLEDIKKVGGLKQYALTEEVEEPKEEALPELSRVFEPGARTRKRKAPKKGFKKTHLTEPKATKKVIRVSSSISVSELSRSMGIKASDIIKKLMELGTMATVNQAIDTDTATLIATEYGYEIENVSFKEEDLIKEKGLKPDGTEAVAEGEATPRSPVVTVMGHVDHGKTSILDVIREADVVSTEAGGITQHIGAYTVTHAGKDITFIDTPGHEAFTHMRARGAQVTDIVILVVAADDGVMPQTKEAIDHSRAAGVPMVVAINKIDKPNASLDKVKRSLSEVGLLPEDWGGETICVPTSAKTKEGIDRLLEMVLLQAEMLELKARRQGRAKGIVVESKMDKQRGPAITVVVKEGTLRIGDALICGGASGKAKALVNSKGEAVQEVFPSQPVEILGLSVVPEAGEQFLVVKDEKTAKLIVEHRQQKSRHDLLAKRTKITLEDLKTRVEQGEVKGLNIIVKTDVKGVADAVRDSLPGLSTKDVKINVLHTGVGGVTENDIMLAAASDAVIVGFNVVADPSARALAEIEGVEIKTYSIIYEMLDDIKKAIAGLLAPKEIEKILGRAEVRDTFKVPKLGIVAGCMVTSGKVTRTARVRLLRDNIIIHDGKIVSLRHFKDDAKEVAAGMECGIGIEKFGDVKIGDELEVYLIESIATTWEESKGENPKS